MWVLKCTMNCHDGLVTVTVNVLREQTLARRQHNQQQHLLWLKSCVYEHVMNSNERPAVGIAMSHIICGRYREGGASLSAQL